MHRIVTCKTTKKYSFTIYTSLLILMLTVSFPVEQQPKSGIDHITFEISRSHTETHTHIHTNTRTVGQLWKIDRLVTGAATHTTNTMEEHAVSLIRNRDPSN
jgi:hypothetical protein